MEPTKKTEEAAPTKPVARLVKVRAKRPIMDAKGAVILPGKIGEVEESIAKEMCEPKLGHHTFFGERFGTNDLTRADLTRAEYVTQPAA